MRKGSTMIGSSFDPISGSGTAIQDITPQGDDIEEGSVSVQTLDSRGATVDMYIYYGKDMWDDDMPAGWYTDDGLADATFEAGTGLWLGAPDATTTITFSGKVPTNDVEVTLRKGSTAVANMMPVSINIQDIVPSGDDIDEGTVSIQTLDSRGATVDMYIYYGKDMWDDDMPAGWYTDDGLANVEFAAGEGLWVGAPDASTSIRFPAPEL